MAAATGFGDHTSTLRMKTSGEQTKHVPLPLPDELTTRTDTEARLHANRVLQMTKPEQEPVASRTMDWNPYSNCKRLGTAWSKGSWRSNVKRQCLYHHQTRTVVSLIGGDDLGRFGLKRTIHGKQVVLDIDNVDFGVDPIEIVTNGSLDDPDLEGEIEQKLRMVLTGRKLPAQELKFKPATVYKNISTSQLVAIVGSPEHANAEEIKHVLVAEVTDDGEINIEKITKAKKEHLVKENGRCCNEENMLADIRRIYFPSFARSQQGNSFDIPTSKMEQQFSDMEKLKSVQEENNRLQQELSSSKEEIENHIRQKQSLKEQLLTSQEVSGFNFEHWWESQQECRTLAAWLEHSTEENQTLKQSLSENQLVVVLTTQLVLESQQENERLNDRLLDSQQKNQTLDKQLSNSRQENQTLHQLLSNSRRENQILHQWLSKSKQEKQTFIQQMSGTREEVQILNQQLLSRREENASLNQQLSTSREENQTLNQQLSSSRQENQTLNQQLSSSRQENQTLNQQLSSSRQENQTLNQQLSTSRQEKQTLNLQLSTSREENQTLNQQLSTSREENQTLNQQLSTSRQENLNLSQQLSERREEIQSLSQQLSTSGQENRNLNQQLSDSEDQMLSLHEQLSNSQALCSHQHHLLLGADMVETSLPHIESLASDCCLFATHRAKCSSCQQVSPFLDHMRMCSNCHCEKCNKIVNLYTVHVSHCQERNCNFPYCTHCKRFSQQRNLSTQHLATDPEFHEEVRNCLRAIPSQVKRDDAVFHLGEPDPYHKYQSSHAVQIVLLKMFPSLVIPIEKLVVECFTHHEEWSSLRHKKSCPSCQIFLQVLQSCGNCHLDKCFTCGNACCACAKHVLMCCDKTCKFPFCHSPFKGRVGPGDTIFPTEETLLLFREYVHQLCFPQGQNDET
ncbi:uncharacterized protein LOC144883992 [Branchiostoma floridae x Branchiostoma japonicum]